MNDACKNETLYMPISKSPMFYKIMHENKDVCIQLLQIILGFEIDRLEYQNEEQVIKTGLLSKGIRMDVYAKGSDKVYDIEMQSYPMDFLPLRLRYYQGAIDTNTVKRGTSYSSLNESFIIFICTFDLYKLGLPRYDLEVKCLQDFSLETELKQHFIILNTSAYMKAENDNMQALLEYINNGIVNNDKFVKKLDNLVGQANEDKAWVSNMWEGISLLEDAEIRTKDLEAREREAEAREREAEAREKNAEAREKDVEARERDAEAKMYEAQRSNKLTDFLLENDRIDDLKRCTKDPEFKQQIMEELGI